MTTTGAATLTPSDGTPDGLPVDLAGPSEPASWSRRVVAFLLDWAVLAFGTFLVAGDVGSFEPVPFFTASGLDPAPAVRTPSWWGVVVLIACLVLLQAYTGSTPGKAAVAIAVVDDRSGRPIGVLRTVARWIAHLVDAILCIGYLRPLWHPERRTFADSWQGTLVVFRPAMGGTPVRLAATAVCLVAVAGSLSQGAGSTTVASSAADCGNAPDGHITATVQRDRVESWASRLGVIRRERLAEPQPVVIDLLEGVPSGTDRLVVTAAPYGPPEGDLRDALRAHTWNVDLADFPAVEITPDVAPDDLNQGNDADGLEVTAYDSSTLDSQWSLNITPSEVHQLGPGINVQVVAVIAGTEELACAASLDTDV